MLFGISARENSKHVMRNGVRRCAPNELKRLESSLLAPTVRWGMTPRLLDYIEAGKALDADERLEAAHQLLLSVDQDAETARDDIDAAWDETIARRVSEIVSGTARLVNGREAHDRVRAELAALRA